MGWGSNRENYVDNHKEILTRIDHLQNATVQMQQITVLHENLHIKMDITHYCLFGMAAVIGIIILGIMAFCIRKMYQKSVIRAAVRAAQRQRIVNNRSEEPAGVEVEPLPRRTQK